MKSFLKIFFLMALFLSEITYASEIKFIHITDINLNTQNAYKLQETIKEINSYSDIDFIVFGGNNISKTNIDNLNTFLYLLKRTKIKPYVLLGSSDVLSSSGIDKKYYLKRVKRALFFRHSSKPNYVFQKKDVVFVIMDGSKQYFQSSNGCYKTQELVWLDKTLNKYKDKNVVILQHFPILESSSQWLQTARVENYWEMLKKHKNVKLIVSGHYGNNYEGDFGGIHHIITESYSKQGAYNIIQLDFNDNFIGTYLVK